MEKIAKLTLGDVRPLPQSVRQAGREWPVRPGARGVLRILRMLEDDAVAAQHKTALLIRWFFVEDVPPDPVGPSVPFCAPGRTATGTTARRAILTMSRTRRRLSPAFSSSTGWTCWARTAACTGGASGRC